jgi:hypothetical protein
MLLANTGIRKLLVKNRATNNSPFAIKFNKNTSKNVKRIPFLKPLEICFGHRFLEQH